MTVEASYHRLSRKAGASPAAAAPLTPRAQGRIRWSVAALSKAAKERRGRRRLASGRGGARVLSPILEGSSPTGAALEGIKYDIHIVS